MGTTPVDERADHLAGPRDAPVTLVEYGDYQCPFTRAAAPVVDAVRVRLGRRLRLVWRQFPLEDLHPLARGAAEAAEAAAVQGAFWPLHAALLTDPVALEPHDLVEHARRAGVPDPDRLRGELAEHTHGPAVDAAIARARDSGVAGTPTFFVNGTRYEGPLDERALGQVLLDAAEERVRPR
jgi:protein-disulfide isomerase